MPGTATATTANTNIRQDLTDTTGIRHRIINDAITIIGSAIFDA